VPVALQHPDHVVRADLAGVDRHDHAQDVVPVGADLRPLTRQISQYQAEINQLQAQTAGGNLTSDPELQALRTQLSQAQAKGTSDYDTWQCQLYGTAASGQVCKSPGGSGPLAQASQQNYNADRTQVTQLNQQISAREAQLSQLQASEAKAQLPVVKRSLQAAENEQLSKLATSTARTRTTQACWSGCKR